MAPAVSGLLRVLPQAAAQVHIALPAAGPEMIHGHFMIAGKPPRKVIVFPIKPVKISCHPNRYKYI